MITFEQRRELRYQIDQHKRQAIAQAHGRTLESIFGKIGDCEHCGTLISATRRFCGQECITAHRRAAA